MLISLQNRHILLGVSGSIAAYKAVELIRILRENGAVVRVVMTEAAQAFITPLTLQAISGFPVHLDLLDSTAEEAMGHIQLARWADLIVIAPASANFIARLAQGRGDDLLSAVCLATAARIAIAPAMNQGMWNAPSVGDNIALLRHRQIMIWGPDSGSQACGDIGLGRMLEPSRIYTHISQQFMTGKLAGMRIVITAGPTREKIDAVRYISNFSSGKMGYALAQACVDAGAAVQLISGPVKRSIPQRVKCINVVQRWKCALLLSK